MKLFLICSFVLLSSCESDTHQTLLKAKNNPEYEVCFSVYQPTDVEGKYCMRYGGKL